MRRLPTRFTVSAPGRICLFGEHQDYLGLPVIAMAVNLRFYIEWTADGSPNSFTLSKPDIHQTETIPLNQSEPLNGEDFCFAIYSVLRSTGFSFPAPGTSVFSSHIPIQAGCSSSSAMCAAWAHLLLHIGENANNQETISPEEVAYLIYSGEKTLLQGSGGMMDQYSCYLGGMQYIYKKQETESTRPYGAERLNCIIPGLYLVHSGEKKDTQGVLKQSFRKAIEAMAFVKREAPHFDLYRTSAAELDRLRFSEQDGQMRKRLMVAQLKNRDLCQEALQYFRRGELPANLGAMLNEQHEILSKYVGVSTPRIDQMLATLRTLGALGGKINGSGGGGTFFVYVGHDEALARRLEDFLSSEKLWYHKIQEADGARIEP